MTLLTQDGVYLITNVAYPTHYLVSNPDHATPVAATTTTLQCWRLQRDPKTSNWTMRAIVNDYAHHLNYGGEGTSYLAITEGTTTVVADKTWVTLQPIKEEDEYYYRIENEAKNLVASVQFAPGERTYAVSSLPCSEDIFTMSRQFWEFKLMPHLN